jgi:hypothetical protein
MNEKSVMTKSVIHILLIACASFVLGLAVQVLLSVGDFWKGALAAFYLICFVTILLYLVWRAVGSGKALAKMMILAFLLRLALGVFLTWGLPRFGYQETPQQAGFVFEDAYRREANAWDLAQSEDPLLRAFGEDYSVDQYGGLLALDAFVYRFISPDAYRPVLISILSAGVMALSLPFLTAAVGRSFGQRAAVWAGWAFSIYPEGVLLGAAQMREPFLIFFFSVLIWSTAQLLDRNRKQLKAAIPLFVFSAISLFLFSYRVAAPLMGVILVWVWVVESAKVKQTWIKGLIWMIAIVALVGVAWFYRDWVSEVMSWDARLTLIASGRIQFELESLPAWLHFPFVVIYGLFQPVLPAAIAAPAPWIWRGLGIFRALGWYALLPFLAYALIRILRLPGSRQKRWLVVMVLFVWAWVFVASARAGGDQWDNPRYRTILLPWMALIFGWAVNYAKDTKDRWLGRVLLLEGIFLAFFTEWYISRYYPVIPRLDFWLMIVIILVISLFIIIGGWLRDQKEKRERRKSLINQ